LCEVRKESKCCNRAMKDRSIEFAEDIGASEVSCDNYERAKVSWMHFAIESFLNLCILHK
jgi:hypothetical protein